MNEGVASDLRETGERPGLLLVDDDGLIVESLTLVLQDSYEVYSAANRKEAKQLLHRLEGVPPLALIDLGLPPLPHKPDEGFELVTELLVINPEMKILVLSGQSEMSNIQHALTLGAVDFVPKPCDVPLLKTRLAHQAMMLRAEQDLGSEGMSRDTLLGDSEAIKTLHASITQYADTPYPVLIEGESGTGKELVAQYIHDRSARSKAPFLTINCAAFTAELLEAQLFGHRKGAFTGATSHQVGFFEESGEGSLFLDEIGELPANLQSKLLRVLENGEYYRLGETQARTSNARIIAATNRDLRQEVREGRFRQDLYHRLSVLTITVPPLRERGADSLILFEEFRKVYALGNAPFTLNEEASKFLMEYPFPGNVRELRNIVIRLGAKHAGKPVGVRELMMEVEPAFTAPAMESSQEQDEAMETELREKGFRLDARLDAWERRYISMALDMSGGNLSKAARLLGINRTTLYSRIQRLSIHVPE